MANESEIYRGLTEIFHDVFMRDDMVVTADLTSREVEGWDSFKQIEIVMASEERWGIKFRTRELDSLQSVGDLVAMIARKTA